MSKTTSANSNPESSEKLQGQSLQESDKQSENFEASPTSPHQDRKDSQKVVGSTQDETPSSLSEKYKNHVPDQADHAPQKERNFLKFLHPVCWTNECL